MITLHTADRQTANDALDSLEMAKRALGHLETVLFIAEGMAAENPRLRSLLNLAWFHATDAANVACGQIEDLNVSLNKSAPQNAEMPNRGAHGGEA